MGRYCRHIFTHWIRSPCLHLSLNRSHYHLHCLLDSSTVSLDVPAYPATESTFTHHWLHPHTFSPSASNYHQSASQLQSSFSSSPRGSIYPSSFLSPPITYLHLSHLTSPPLLFTWTIFSLCSQYWCRVPARNINNSFPPYTSRCYLTHWVPPEVCFMD